MAWTYFILNHQFWGPYQLLWKAYLQIEWCLHQMQADQINPSITPNPPPICRFSMDFRCHWWHTYSNYCPKCQWKWYVNMHIIIIALMFKLRVMPITLLIALPIKWTGSTNLVQNLNIVMNLESSQEVTLYIWKGKGQKCVK